MQVKPTLNQILRYVIIVIISLSFAHFSVFCSEMELYCHIELQDRNSIQLSSHTAHAAAEVLPDFARVHTEVNLYYFHLAGGFWTQISMLNGTRVALELNVCMSLAQGVGLLSGISLRWAIALSGYYSFGYRSNGVTYAGVTPEYECHSSGLTTNHTDLHLPQDATTNDEGSILLDFEWCVEVILVAWHPHVPEAEWHPVQWLCCELIQSLHMW